VLTGVGDPETSFLEYMRADTAALSRVAFLLTGDRQLAEDLVQETLLRVVGRWGRIVATGDPRPYVRRVMYHQHVSLWRRARLRIVPMEHPPDRRVPDVADAADVAVSVSAALAKLAPRQRAVLVLRYFEDRTERETAEILGLGIGTVKSHTRDALARLRVIAPDLSMSEPSVGRQ
jgi:RNA polymerase sigma-70 factor (sigma-E family)